MKIPVYLKRWFDQWRQPLRLNHLSAHRRSSKSSERFPVILVLAVVSLTGAVGHRFYNDPKLAIGTPAPETVYAPSPATIQDTQATEVKKAAIRQQMLPIFVVNESATQQVLQRLNQQLVRGDRYRDLVGPFPYARTSILSTGVQGYLRQRSPQESARLTAALSSSPGSESLQSWESPMAQRVLTELRAYQQKADPPAWSQLLATISQAQGQYQQAAVEISRSQSGYDTFLLDLPETEWQAVQRQLRQSARQMLALGISPGLPEAMVQNAVELHGESLPPVAQALGINVLLKVLQPNLVVDLEQSRQHVEQAAQNIQPVTFKVQQGEVIVRAGEPINYHTFIILDEFGLTRRGINWLGLLATGAATSGAIAIFWLVQVKIGANLSRRDQVLILLLALTAPLIGWTVGITYTSLPAVGLLVSSFYGSALGVTVVGLLTLLMPLGMQAHPAVLVAVAVGSLLGGVMAGRLRSREELALLGVGIALLQGTTYLILLGVTGGVGYGLLRAAALQGLRGLAWSIVALGVTPYLEQLFDLVTPARLAELANPNRPLLKRLAMETPGTFQHTLFVASLAEAGARALGCNVELVRTGTLYHDIGKMHDPLSFIENQLGGPNKHDSLADPWLSAEIIKKHVTEGLAMARRYRLPKAVQAFIPEHQGTILVSYFYYQAQQRQDLDKPVNEADFRYPGPIPQSRETGITMLADACEAALRSLKETTPEEGLIVVKKIFKARWQEQQLVDSDLSREDLQQLAEVFIQVWMQFNHQRIRYPSPPPSVPA